MNDKDKQLIGKIVREIVEDAIEDIKKENSLANIHPKTISKYGTDSDYFTYSEFMDAKENGEINDLIDVQKYTTNMDSWDTRAGFMFGAELDPVSLTNSRAVAMADDGFVAIRRDGTVDPIARDYPMIIGGCKPCGLYVPFSISEDGYKMVQEIFSINNIFKK